MLSDMLMQFAIATPEANKSGIDTVMANLGIASTLELVVVSGGPVFLFKEPLTAEQCHESIHSVNPTFFLCASVGMVACRLAEPNLGQLTVCADVGSIGYVRLVKELKNPGAEGVAEYVQS